MDIPRARSPPTLSRRPIGPRNPGKPGTLPVKSIIPLDLTARLLEDAPIIPRTASPEQVADSSRPDTPMSAPLHLSRTASASSDVDGEPEISPGPSTPNEEEPRASADGEVGGGSVHAQTQEEEGAISFSASDPALNPSPDAPTRDQPYPRADSPFRGPETETVATDAPAPALHLDAAEMPVVTAALPPIVPVSPAPATEVSSPLPAYSSSPIAGSPPTDASVVPVFSSVPIPSRSSVVVDVSGSPPVVPHDQDSPPLTPHTDTTNTDSTHVSGVNLLSTKDHERALSETGVQASTVSPARFSTPTSTRASTPALLKAMQKRPLVGMPPPLNLESEPVPWKGMTLDAAQWTFTSEQLQETVSKAIKLSASESFIRVVSTQVYDTELPQELERLEALRLTTQAQYRFNMQRRGNLLQSLSVFSHQTDEIDSEAMYDVTSQLAELTVACDRLMESLFRISDQKAQIQRVEDLHIASALAMGLRKLNASYAKRVGELKEARARNAELQAELEEAWNMAQDMAQEMDDLDNFDLAFSDGDITPDDDDEPINSALDAEIYGDTDRLSAVTSVHQAKVVEITGKAVATKATFTNISGLPKPGDRSSRVSAAKKRSSRTSKASLRIPKTPLSRTPTLGNGERPDRTSIQSMRSRVSRSRSVRRGEQTDETEVTPTAPDVPIIRVPEPNRSRDGSFLELSQTRPTSPAGATTGHLPPLPPKDAFISVSQPTTVSSRSEENLVPNRPPSPTLGTIPTIRLPDEPQHHQKGLSWTGRKIFARRVHSMQPALRAVDDATDPSHLARPVSEYKQFDGWPSLFGSVKAGQRFSVPVLAGIPPLKTRKSSDSAPAGSTSSA